MRRIPMSMADWVAKLDAFLLVNDREILRDAGRVSHELALETAHQAYDKFHARRIAQKDEWESDFDQAVRQLPPIAPKNPKSS